MADDDVRVEERGRRRLLARRLRVRSITSSQAVPRFATGTEPASSRKSGVLATTARWARRETPARRPRATQELPARAWGS
ncbi:MAG: hypothetical protein AVDCRST_MAG53-79 [uncultured Solirubrobacteraceae bacterium]|uniref:Uncharacterized protein n=1 Tax=uncultured Solirubrobacteraceae bacterium TaxID=1162706 RepID=A0A6J4RHZ6_9ACTN|nr:MAG: hypothetical protein AVDCRST_MAG53-79 [uncultured Solirubrobacteraceae bacterium]